MSIVAIVVLLVVLLVNTVTVVVDRLRSFQPVVSMVAPIVAGIVFIVRNYLSNQRAYELFVADRLVERSEVARQHAAWGPVIHAMVAGVIVVSVVGFTIRWFRTHGWWTGTAVLFWLAVLVLWLMLRQVHWTRMV